MIPDCDGRSDGRSDGRTESIIAKTALCIASYADALSKTNKTIHFIRSCVSDRKIHRQANGQNTDTERQAKQKTITFTQSALASE